jgi:hypothetical protein
LENKEITDSRAKRLAEAKKFFEKYDAERAEKREQGKDLDDVLGLDRSR